MTRLKPVRQLKEGKNGVYKLLTGCGQVTVTITDDEDGYPIRVVVEEKVGEGGCPGGVQYLRRSLTYILECNLDLDSYISEVMEKIICPSAKSRSIKEKDKVIHLSCAKAVAFALRKHLEKKEEKTTEETKTTT